MGEFTYVFRERIYLSRVEPGSRNLLRNCTGCTLSPKTGKLRREMQFGLLIKYKTTLIIP